MTRLTLALCVLLLSCGCGNEGQQPRPSEAPGNSTATIVLATTTSAADTGLLDVLLPEFEKRTGIRVKSVAVGSGEALKMGERGDADIILGHSPKAEQEFMRKGFSVDRRTVMSNDFVLVGPQDDPAGVRDAGDMCGAFKRIAASRSKFASRGDRSGTHAKELEIWALAGIVPNGDWYMEAGAGQGELLRICDEKKAYGMSDSATFMIFRERLQIAVLYDGDAVLANLYSIVRVNPTKSPGVKADAALELADFFASVEGQALIGSFGRERFGRALFKPVKE
jgi:tungstate transport system substrate-binding protein